MKRASLELHFYTKIGSNAHEQCITLCPVSRLVHSPGCLASVIAWKVSPQDPGITILGSQLTRLARCHNRKVYFCCVLLRCWDLCKASQPTSCNQSLSSRFYALPLDLTDFLKPLNTYKQNFSPTPSTSSYPLLYINELSFISILSIQILSKVR